MNRNYKLLQDNFQDIVELNIKNFGNIATEEWANFVLHNRNRTFKNHSNPLSNQDNKYDIVIGCVANDDIALLLRQYQNELIDFDTLIKGLTYKKLSNQYSFHTEKSIQLLQKIKV